MPASAEEASPEAAAPFSHRIRVGWADCDPARIAYTGRIPVFALEAIDAWWEARVGHDWYRLNLDWNVGTPFVHLGIDFRAPITPRFPLDCSVRLARLGRSSITFAVQGVQADTVCFEGTFVEVFVDAATFEKIPAPADIARMLSPLIEPTVA